MLRFVNKIGISFIHKCVTVQLRSSELILIVLKERELKNNSCTT
jgi:hypothetical protein